MWFNKTKNSNLEMNYDVHNDSYGYDESYSESSTEFMTAPSYVGGSISLSYAQESIMSAIIKKLKNCFSTNNYVDENYNDSYNDCSYNEVYDED